MTIKDSFTPKDTEEVKPNLFIQKKGDKYRVIEPFVWNGKFRIKEQLKTIISLRTILSLGFVLLLVWAYIHDAGALREFYFKVNQNPVIWCTNVFAGIPRGNLCTPQWEKAGLCETDELLNKLYATNISQLNISIINP